MSFKPEDVKEAREFFKKKLDDARVNAEKRTAEVYAKIPKLRDADAEFRKIGMQIVGMASEKLSYDEREKKMIEIISRCEKLSAGRAELLKSKGYSENYTEVIYECGKCKDTGYVGARMCTCFKNFLTLKSYKNSGLGSLLGKQSFENFNLAFYKEKEAKKNMEYVFAETKEYAEKFCKSSPNLLFVGGTGLGKTHLSTSIAKMVIEKGFDVLYAAAYDLISDFEKERFGRADKTLTDKYFASELLIIDDLGTETQNSFVISCIYGVINSRYNNGFPTIINTNLKLSDLKDKYTERVASRLLGEYNVLVFLGEDIRLLKTDE